ncbi:MAG: leader peptide processing enzyme [Treponema sp.]|jgi:amino acid transporter|nr:leader peptide processing enzyme [Treponema sp.]
MNKKVNTLLFVLGATLFNIIVTVLCFVGLLLLYAKSLMPFLPEENRSWGFPVIFIGAIALSFFIYQLILKLLMKKIEMEKYFDPIFGRKHK